MIGNIIFDHVTIRQALAQFLIYQRKHLYLKVKFSFQEFSKCCVTGRLFFHCCWRIIFVFFLQWISPCMVDKHQCKMSELETRPHSDFEGLTLLMFYTCFSTIKLHCSNGRIFIYLYWTVVSCFSVDFCFK